MEIRQLSLNMNKGFLKMQIVCNLLHVYYVCLGCFHVTETNIQIRVVNKMTNCAVYNFFIQVICTNCRN